MPVRYGSSPQHCQRKVTLYVPPLLWHTYRVPADEPSVYRNCTNRQQGHRNCFDRFTLGCHPALGNIRMSSMSRQMALALFADYSPTDRGVDDAPLDLGFRRNNALIKIVDLSLAGRRMIDVAYFLAAEDIELHKEYRVDLGLFRWLLGTTSRNQRHLAKIIREAQRQRSSSTRSILTILPMIFMAPFPC